MTMLNETRLNISRVTLTDLDALAPLFDAYRVFYQKTSDLNKARAFLRERIAKQESVILLAREAESRAALGFTQLYPSFSSVSAGRMLILNDLFVDNKVRGCGVAHALLESARQHALRTKSLYLTLSTAHDNLAARGLYESLGYVRDADMVTYALALS